MTNLYQYDKLNRLTTATWKLNTNLLASYYYQLGRTGNRTNLIETSDTVYRTYAWQYDRLYRLTNENISTGDGAGYVMDAVGNRLNRTGANTQTLAYNTNDWLTTDAYDSNGNTLWTTNGGMTMGPYQYDAENHVTNFNNDVAMVYNGDGLRVSKIVGTQTNYYLLDDRNPTGYAQVLEEWIGASGSVGLSRVYNYGMSLISQRVPGTSTNYFIFDGHGSTRILTDQNGSVVNTLAYDAYGNLIASNAAPLTVYLYCGQQYDANMGLYLNRARYLNPNTGRFWTMDTSEGSQTDPLSLHKYLYCKASPTILTDPSGHDGSEVEFSLVTAISVSMNAYSAAANIRAGRYGWAAVDILSAGLGLGGMIGPGMFGQLVTDEQIIANAAQLRAGIQGAQNVCRAWALVDLFMMTAAPGEVEVKVVRQVRPVEAILTRWPAFFGHFLSASICTVCFNPFRYRKAGTST